MLLTCSCSNVCVLVLGMVWDLFVHCRREQHKLLVACVRSLGIQILVAENGNTVIVQLQRVATYRQFTIHV